jgi:signal transduction histidine kinase
MRLFYFHLIVCFSISFLKPTITYSQIGGVTKRLPELNKLARLFPDSIDDYYQEIFIEFTKIDCSTKDSIISEEINKYLEFLYSVRKYKKLKEICDKLIAKPNKNLKNNAHGNILVYKAFLSYLEGRDDEALDTLKQAEAILKLTGNLNVDMGKYLLGIIYSSKEKYKLSNNYLFNLISVRKVQVSALDSIYLSGLYSLVGKNYIALDDLKNARKYLLKSQNYNLGRSDYEVLNLIYTAEIYNKEGDFDSEIISLIKAKESLQRNNPKSPNLEANIFQKLGVVYSNTNKMESAIFYFDSLISVARSNNMESYLFEGLIGKGKNYLAKSSFKLALKCFLEAQNLRKENDSLLAIRRVQLNVSKCYYGLKEHKEAYEYLIKYVISKESLLKLEKEKQKLIKEKEQQIELLAKDKVLLTAKEKQKALELKKSKSDIHNLILITAFFGISVFFLIFFLISRDKKNKDQLRFIEKDYQLKRVEAKFEGQEKERNRLASELHDGIGSSILVLKMGLGEENIKLIKELDLIYNEVRMVSHDLKSPYYIEGESVNEMTKYLIMDMLLVNNISVEYLCYPEDKKVYLTEKKHVTLYRVLQEIFTNIIKHANTSKVDISYTFLKDRLNIVIIDYGQGFDMESSDSWRRGVGMQNLYSRIKVLQGTIFVESSIEQGTDIVIDIPYETLLANNHNSEAI